MTLPSITIYTDGSCHTQLSIGAWASVILFNDDKKILTGTAIDTTHQRMELMAAIEALNYVQSQFPEVAHINLVSDSQYVIGLQARRQKLEAANYNSKQGEPIQNADLVQMLYQLSTNLILTFTKVKAHLKKTGLDDFNIEVDKLCRKLVREMVNSEPMSLT